MNVPSRELTPEDSELIEFARQIMDANTDREDGVGTRGLDSRVQRLELGSDFLFGLAGDLPPDPLPVRAIAERDRTHVPVPRGVQVDPVLAEPTAPDIRLGRSASLIL
jgi:hypothetical protein